MTREEAEKIVEKYRQIVLATAMSMYAATIIPGYRRISLKHTKNAEEKIIAAMTGEQTLTGEGEEKHA